MEEKNKSSLGHMPSTERWAFDDAVTDVFPDMLQRSIPQYQVMRRAVYDVGARFVRPSTHVVDLGCSRGDSLAPFVATFGAANRYVGIDKAPAMIRVVTGRFSSEIERGIVTISDQDLIQAYPQVSASLTLSILTLQFVSPEHRLRILTEACRNTNAGGALVLVEKIKGSSTCLDDLMIDLYHELKSSNGYSREEIERKRDSLKGVLIPFAASDNEDLLRSAGFREVDCFWRWMNFGGFVALK
jgi:tRNA (cmo5U34)-methyltransferase